MKFDQNDDRIWPRKRRFNVRSIVQSVLALCVLVQTGLFAYTQFYHDTRQRSSSAGIVRDEVKWQDNVYPLRPTKPWDISTDFPFPRTLEYDVDEGTWIRLDVHPTSGELVFDLLGDIYCLPSTTHTSPLRAVPVLRGIPWDSDPHFSPSGDRIVFRSDAELGVENIWVMPWNGCESQNAQAPPGVLGSLYKMLAEGTRESSNDKLNRLTLEGRAQAHRVTNETYRWVTDARWHPSGSSVVATKWFFSERSLGAGEGWQFDVPSRSDTEVQLGSGQRVLPRRLPFGWSPEQYNDQQVGREQIIWNGGDSLIFSENVRDTSGEFTYSKDVHKGIYAIISHNLTTGRTETLVDATPGGASRPQLSRDGRTLAYVTRVRDKEALALKDLATGTVHHAWYGLTFDLTTVYAPMGTYPSFAFTPNDDAVIIWAAGKIWSVPLAKNKEGERVRLPVEPRIVPFVVHVEKPLAETRHAGVTDLVRRETADTARIHAFKELSIDERGTKAVFQAAGLTYIHHIGQKGKTIAVPVSDTFSTYYTPSFVPHRPDLVLHARWSDVNFTTFELVDITGNNAVWTISEGLPIGRYSRPVLCQCQGNDRNIAFIKRPGSLLTGDIVATASPGIYIAELTLPLPATKQLVRSVPLSNIRFVPTIIDPSEDAQLSFLDGNRKLLVQQYRSAFVVNLARGSNDKGVYEEENIATGRTSVELAVSNDLEHVAFKDFQQAYVVAEGKHFRNTTALWSKPGNATVGLARVSLDGAHDLTWGNDGKTLFWLLGPYLHSLSISAISECQTQIRKDTSTFGIDCVKQHVAYEEIVVTYETDVARLQREVQSRSSSNSDVLVLTNATILTMHTGEQYTDLIRDGALVVRRGVIEQVGRMSDVRVPDGANVINAEQGWITPGFIDVHAHWSGFADTLPARSWEMNTFLAYGVTTLHNPSSNNRDGWVERFRLESGKLLGPRIYHTGSVVYGAEASDVRQEINDMEDAHAALTRIQVEGGPSSFSYKNYNQPSRAARQRLLLAARNKSMACFPEGGMNLDWDLTYIVDGMTTVEHALPVPFLYNDILTLFSESGTGSTPTHLVNYGGAWGEQVVWATMDVPNDPRLRHFTRHDILETLSESTSRPYESWSFLNTSLSTAKMVRQGLHANIGAHGEPPLGLNYLAEMWFAEAGYLSPYEVLRAATRSGAITLGLQEGLGTLAVGKLADFLVFPADVDILENLRGLTALKYVSRGGRLWNASNLVEEWPTKGRSFRMPPLNAD